MPQAYFNMHSHGHPMKDHLDFYPWLDGRGDNIDPLDGQPSDILGPTDSSLLAEGSEQKEFNLDNQRGDPVVVGRDRMASLYKPHKIETGE